LKQVFFHNKNQSMPVSNIFCIGRNYAAHVAELGNTKPSTPVVFLKPTSALSTEDTLIHLPEFSNRVDYETELVLLIGTVAKQVTPEQALKCITGYGVGLDLTARDLQSIAKEQGLPWTLAKGFDHAACISKFISAEEIGDPSQLKFGMKQNGVIRQQGDVSLMLFDIPHIISYLSTMFTLQPGDLIYTGTPEGTGPINKGDQLEINLGEKIRAKFIIAQ
jgi:2-keto-4-pentenoate hydratase/2-oxohepta-3-ene-1,7-dioic acid hydratase in catechol pathway